jgi:hypothetical protein
MAMFTLEVSTVTEADRQNNEHQLLVGIARIAGLPENSVVTILTEPASVRTSFIIKIGALPVSKEDNVERMTTTLTRYLVTQPELLKNFLLTSSSITNFRVVTPPTTVARFPTSLVESMAFKDVDGRFNYIRGTAVLHLTTPRDLSVSHYNVYFGDGNGNKAINKVGAVVAKVPATDQSSLTFTVPETKVSPYANEWLVFSANPSSESLTAYATHLDVLVRQPVDLLEGSLAFTDTNERPGWIQGTAVITTTQSQGFTDFVLYFGNGGVHQSNKVGHALAEGHISATGKTIMTIPAPIPIPDGVDHLLVFARNVDVEGEIGVTEQFFTLR